MYIGYRSDERREVALLTLISFSTEYLCISYVIINDICVNEFDTN